MRRACTGVDEQGRVEQPGPGSLVRAMRAVRQCERCSVCVRWLLAVLWENMLRLPSEGVLAAFLMAQRSWGQAGPGPWGTGPSPGSIQAARDLAKPLQHPMLLPGFLTVMSWCMPSHDPELVAPWWRRKGGLLQAGTPVWQQAADGRCWGLRLGLDAGLCLCAGEEVQVMLRMWGFRGTPPDAVFFFVHSPKQLLRALVAGDEQPSREAGSAPAAASPRHSPWSGHTQPGSCSRH